MKGGALGCARSPPALSAQNLRWALARLPTLAPTLNGTAAGREGRDNKAVVLLDIEQVIVDTMIYACRKKATLDLELGSGGP